MKKFMFMTLLCITGAAAKAQTAAEILQQRKTQKKYLLQQIAAFAVMRILQRKGDAVTGTGWKQTEAIKNADKKQHQEYYKNEGYATEKNDNSHTTAGGGNDDHNND